MADWLFFSSGSPQRDFRNAKALDTVEKSQPTLAILYRNISTMRRIVVLCTRLHDTHSLQEI
jgi:hypothetical protein